MYETIVKHIVNISGGACSLLAGVRVAERFGTENTTFLFADTLEESADLYSCLDHLAKLTGIPITRICDGRRIWQLFREQGLIGNARFPICSVILKREPLDLWRRQNALEMDSILYLGFDFTESNRIDDMRASHPSWRIEAPMCEAPLLDKCQIIKESIRLGFPEAELYRLGFPHNNCGGCCVRAGISHWVHLYRTLPHRYLAWENEEQEAIADFISRGITPLTILKDRRGGVTKNLSLKDLRVRIEAGEKFRNDEWGGCGCGGAT